MYIILHCNCSMPMYRGWAFHCPLWLSEMTASLAFAYKPKRSLQQTSTWIFFWIWQSIILCKKQNKKVSLRRHRRGENDASFHPLIRKQVVKMWRVYYTTNGTKNAHKDLCIVVLLYSLYHPGIHAHECNLRTFVLKKYYNVWFH